MRHSHVTKMCNSGFGNEQDRRAGADRATSDIKRFCEWKWMHLYMSGVVQSPS
jgi:hypothetical protein